MPAIRNAGVGLQQINFAGASSGPRNSWLYSRVLAYGVSRADASGLRAINRLQLNDSVDNSDGILSGLLVAHRVGGGAGIKHAISADIGVTSFVSPGQDGYLSFVALSSVGYIVANQGGTGQFTNIPGDGYKGSLFGGNDHPRAAGEATFLAGIVGREINVEVEGNASVFSKVGLWIVKGPNDVRQGVAHDVALCIVDKWGSTTPWRNGILFGGPTGVFPFNEDSTIIGTQRRIYPSDIGPLQHRAAYGIDFREVVFTHSALASVGFSVTPEGGIIATLPTTDPGVEGALWSDNNIVKVSHAA